MISLGTVLSMLMLLMRRFCYLPLMVAWLSYARLKSGENIDVGEGLISGANGLLKAAGSCSTHRYLSCRILVQQIPHCRSTPQSRNRLSRRIQMALDLITSDGTAVSAHGSVAEKLLSTGMNPAVPFAQTPSCVRMNGNSLTLLLLQLLVSGSTLSETLLVAVSLTKLAMVWAPLSYSMSLLVK